MSYFAKKNGQNFLISRCAELVETYPKKRTAVIAQKCGGRLMHARDDCFVVTVKCILHVQSAEHFVLIKW